MKTYNNVFQLIMTLTLLGVGSISTLAGPEKSVTVVNTPANPVPVTATNALPVNVQNDVAVHDTDNPGVTPFQDSFSLQIDPGKSADKFEDFAVNIPAGTRLVITRINVLGEMPVGEKLIGVDFSAFVNSSASGSFLGATFHGTSPSGVVFGGPFDIYAGDVAPAGLAADPGANMIEISAFRDSTVDTAHVFVQVFGYVVKL